MKAATPNVFLILILSASMLWSKTLYAAVSTNNDMSDGNAMSETIKIGEFLTSEIPGAKIADAALGWILPLIAKSDNPDKKILHELKKLNKKLNAIEQNIYTVEEIEEQILMAVEDDHLKPYLHKIKDTFWDPILTAALDSDSSTLDKKLKKVLSTAGGLSDVVSNIDGILYDQKTGVDLISSMAVYYTTQHYPQDSASGPIFNDQSYYQDLHKWLASIHYYRTLATMLLVEAHHHKVVKKGLQKVFFCQSLSFMNSLAIRIQFHELFLPRKVAVSLKNKKKLLKI